MLRLTTPDVLLVDDLGLRALVTDEPIDLYEIIRQRYERGSTIFTPPRPSSPASCSATSSPRSPLRSSPSPTFASSRAKSRALVGASS